MTTLRSIRIVLWELISVGTCSLLVGVGIGSLQGILSFRGDLLLGWQGSVVGGMFGPITGWVIYYGLFRLPKRTLSADLFGQIVSFSAFTGALLGSCALLVGPELALPLSLLTPIATGMWAFLLNADSRHERALNTMARTVLFPILGVGVGVFQGIFAYARYAPNWDLLAWGTLGMALGVSFVARLSWRTTNRQPSFLRLCGIVTVATFVGSAVCFAFSELTAGSKGWLGLFATPVVMLVASRQPTQMNREKT